MSRVDESIINLFNSEETGLNMLSSQDVANIAKALKDYQIEIAIKDKEIDLLYEKIRITEHYIESLEDTFKYQIAKEGV